MNVESARPRPATTIQSVSRAARLLMLVATADRPPIPKEMAQTLGLTLPTTYHLLGTLEAEGLIARSRGRTYGLGAAAAVIANALAEDYAVPEQHLLALRELADSTGEQVYLSAWRRGSISVLESVAGTHIVSVNTLGVGYAEHLHARASAKLLLAFASDGLREAMIETLTFEPLTRRTITTEEHFRAELLKVRDAELAFDIEEFADGVTCVSGPVRVGATVVACFTISTPTSRFDESSESLLEELDRACRMASS